MLSDVAGARVVFSRLLDGKVIFHPDLDTRAYTVRAVIALGRVIELMSPTGFEPVLPA